MAGFNVGAFAGGVGSGIEQGQKIRESYEARVAQQLAKKADQNYSTWLEQSSKAPNAPVAPVPSAGGQPPAPAPGQAPQGPMPPQGALPALGGPSPQGAVDPRFGGPPQNVPMPGAQPMQQGPAAAMPPMPPPGATPPPGPGQSPGPGAQPKPGNTPQDDPLQQSKFAIQSIAKEIAGAFPGKKWDKGELLATVDSVLHHTQSLDPITKQIAQLQLQYYKQNLTSSDKERGQDLTHGAAEDRVGATERGQDMQHGDRQAALKTSLQRVAMAQSGADRRASLGAATKLQAEDIIQAGSNGRTQAVLDARQVAQEAGLDEKEWQTSVAAQLKEEGMNDAFVSKLFAAAPVGKAPAQPVHKPLPASPKRSGSSGGSGSATPPPQALQHLQEGQQTTFANGQTWTLKGGKPVRVK